MPITHTFISEKQDTSDATLVQPSHWNAEHDIDIFVDDEVPAGTVDGSNDTFTLAHEPSPASSLRLFVNGLLQYSEVAFTLSGDTITFDSDYIPAEDSMLRAWYRKA